jgi:hypothetical protein
MTESPVDRIYGEYRGASEFLMRSGEISLGSALDASSRKALLLAAASYFESSLCRDVLAFCQDVSASNALLAALVQNKAIARQYHTWFAWDGNTASTFFSLFGTEFRSHMDRLLTSDSELRLAVKDFMEMGRDRNRLVHGDFATFTLEKTIDEIYAQYKSALRFVNCIAAELRSCSQSLPRNESTKSSPAN